MRFSHPARLSRIDALIAARVRSWRHFLLLSCLIMAAALANVAAPMAQAKPPSLAEALEKLEIVTPSGTHEILVEVMRTEEQRERGLMFRRTLAQDHGMLFDFETEQPVMMWMKNTYLPLDMIFIASSGKVVGLAENTTPMSEKIISSGAPAYAVLEVNAGTAKRIGLRIGDMVHHPLFGQ